MIGIYALWMLGVLIIVGLAYLAGKHAESKGYRFSLGFWLSILASPLVAWVVVLALPVREARATIDPKLMLALELEKARMKAAACAHEGKVDPTLS
jgi:hypothetical protein